jgi:hypothetical protein
MVTTIQKTAKWIKLVIFIGICLTAWGIAGFAPALNDFDSFMSNTGEISLFGIAVLKLSIGIGITLLGATLKWWFHD